MGCPKESSLEPFLWNFFQNDLSYKFNEDSLYMYADDHQLYKIEKQLQNVYNQLVKEAELASSWYKENLHQTNVERYQIVNVLLYSGVYDIKVLL